MIDGLPCCIQERRARRGNSVQFTSQMLNVPGVCGPSGRSLESYVSCWDLVVTGRDLSGKRAFAAGTWV